MLVRTATDRSKVIVTGVPPETDLIVRLIEAGAVGYVPREASYEILTETIRAANRNEAICEPRVVASLCARLSQRNGHGVEHVHAEQRHTWM